MPMQLEDVRIDEYYDSKVMPYGMKCTHLPTGLMAMGNCKNESSVLQLKRTLLDQLAIFVGQDEAKSGRITRSIESAENDSLRDQVALLQQQVLALMAGKDLPKPAKQAVIAPKKQGWPKGKPRGKKAAKAVVATPAGDLSEAELLAQQMRPPTDAPQRMPKAHQSHGSTVAVVSPESQARGYRP